ncbi:MAG: hypothetical protein QW165_02635 [Candidatus Woesearchaeota archaeon]
MSSQSNDPIVDLAFYGGIIVFAALIALRLATVVWQFLTSIWQVCALLFATIISTLYFVSAFKLLRYAPMRTDVDLQGIEDPELFDEEPLTEPKVQPAPPVQEEKIEEKHDPKEALLHLPIHDASKLSDDEVFFLQRNEYEYKEFVPLGKNRCKPYLVLEQKPESFEHTFVVYALVEKLTPYVKNIKVHSNPDITFTYNREEFAVEVVIPLELKHSRFAIKAERLNSAFGTRLWFAITRSAYKRSLSRYGEVLTRNQIDAWIKESFPYKHPSS